MTQPVLTKKQSSSKKTRIPAGFVTIKEPLTRSYKYSAKHKKLYKSLKRFKNFKRWINTVWKYPIRKFKDSDWKGALNDLVNWIFDVITEGVPVAIVTYALLGVKFTVLNIFAQGIIVVQLVEYYRRLRKNGPTKQISSKNK